ncbi:hemagglutinin [Neorhizobium sp. P12A]|uniref:peptidoglycan-binding protein n=1 Tax=Neorhizobium sp. P12A TaxID=2268027 RepID=UPI0011F0041F|nr:peptidoglycan-binding protein [Neorhizobium sp. P12A]KAA0699440.1 hemagglutinin [Neorhizobium sp. P12A]
MSGSRSNPPGMSDRTSLDALSRTIEGLEARIEGLMGSSGVHDARQRTAPTYAAATDRVAYAERAPMAARGERDAYGSRGQERPARAEQRPEPISRPDPLTEIRQRQRALEASRERSYSRHDEPSHPEPQSFASRSFERPAQRTAAPAPQRPASPLANPDAMTEIAQALVSLRKDLKQDIADGVGREISALRAEIRSIKANAEDRNFAGDVRDDLARLAESINQLGHTGGAPETAGLKTEFEELRSLMDGLAREDSVRGMENRWDGIEDRLQALDTSGLQEELVSLAYRLDDMKRQLGGMNDSPAVHALEQKLISIATAMEQLGNMMQPQGVALSEQFSAIDMRLDEISRAIAATGRTAANAADPMLIQRLEGRLANLGDQIDLMGRQTAQQQPVDDLAHRIEALTMRIEELGNGESVAKLEERLDQLSYLMERSQKAEPQPDLTRHLADISQKIDALEHGSVNDVLAERLDYLARRIEAIDFQPPAPVSALDEDVVYRLESRLADIADRLETSTAAAPTDTHALRALEDQIAHLSRMISEPRGDAGGEFPAEFDRRMGALEDYMATSDEYIIEAARQAAEAVVEAYSRNGTLGGGAVPAADMSAIAALAEDLRHLEDISRNSDERTHRTFEALHGTLVQIADRLDHMETSRESSRPAPRMPAAEYNVDPFHVEEEQSHHAYASAANAPVMTAAPVRPAPIIRTSTVAEQPVAASMAAAAASTAMDAAAMAEIKAEAKKAGIKSSLFASLGKRFLSGRKAAEPAAVTGERPMIDPAPSIDPVDVMPSEEANELLEPGSGAPDVRKILERVRASQTAARSGNAKAPSESERADYIAAARRAAQAAAMEVDQTQRISPNAKDGGNKGGKAFSRFRRPILLAIGAALLAIMAFPLVNTLTHGKKAPPPAEISALTSATENPAKPVAAPTAPVAQANLGNVAAMPPSIDENAQLPAVQPPVGVPPAGTENHLTSASPLDAGGETFTPPSAAAPAQGASGFVPSTPAPAAPDVSAAAPQAATTATAPGAPAPSIIVPSTIQPPALADAAKNGDPLALFEVGALFTDGRGVPADMKQAASWYQLSADRGFAPAQYRLASLYEKGNGVDRDLAKAKDYYERAANAGNASAMHNLAVLYASGATGPQDYNTAADWFTKAANLGISDSQFNLAILYARGNGVKQDLGQSYKWFAIAAKGGDKDAAQKRDEVANAMKPDQLSAARTAVDTWKPQPVDSKANSADIPDDWTGKGVHTASVDMKKAIRNIQAILNNNGFDAGPPDGSMGEKTVAALKSFQKSIGMEPDGKVTDKVVKALLAKNK